MPASCDCEMRPPEPLPEREASPHDEQAADDFASSAARLPSRARSEYARAIRRNQFSCTPSSKLLLVYNDLHTKNPTLRGSSPGLGASIRSYGAALLAALESGRVMHELPSHVLGGND